MTNKLDQIDDPSTVERQPAGYIDRFDDAAFQERVNNTFKDLPCVSLSQAGAAIAPPTHLLDSNKYIEYSLKDTGAPEHIDEETLNRHVAMSFLSDLKKRKESEALPSNQEDVSIEEDHHVYHKPSLKSGEASQLHG
eukprot:Ihof_evm6s103 gene=Ihof_evmTU6s103